MLPNDPSSTDQPGTDRSDNDIYRVLIDSITDYAVFMLDPLGTVASWNPGAARSKGYQAVEIVGQHFSCFYTAKDRAAGLPESALATAARCGKFEGEGWRVRRDGRTFWAHVVIEPVRDRAGTLLGFAKVTRDLTERRLLEDSVSRRDDQFRRLVQSFPEYAIYMLDPGGRVASWNAGAQKIKGYSESEILGRSFVCFYTEEDRLAGEPERALEIAEREGGFEAEAWRVRRDGSRFWANVVIHPILTESGDLAGFSKVTRDISEAKAARDAIVTANQALQRMNEVLGRSEARFRLVVEATPNSILMADRDGAIRMVNAAAERMFGYARAELLGRPVEMLLPANRRSRHAALRHGFFAAPAARAMGGKSALTGLRKDGSAVPVEVGLTPVDTDDGTMVVVAIVDITERLALEAQFRQAQKMEVMGRLVAGVAHDFNNILQVILGGMDVLKDEAPLSPAAETVLDAVERTALRGADLTTHLLSYSHKQVLNPKPLDPCQVVEKLRSVLDRTLPSNVALTIRAPAASGLVRIDRAQLETALMNLAINASHAMPDGGTLLVEVCFTAGPPVGATGGGPSGVLKPGRHAVIAVEDNGSGMSPEVLASAFDPFFTTKGTDGTGLGLAMVQGFSRQSGGDVRATSAPGQGTRFEIWLPEDPGGEMELAAPAPSAALRSGSVLLVDDSRDVLVTVGAFLRRGGYAVEHAEGFHQALALLEAGRRFDALVTDYMIPGLSGLELVKRARDFQPGLPALVISGYAEVTNFMTGLPNATLLQKPFQRNAFLATLGSLISYDTETVMETVVGLGSPRDHV